MTSAQVVLPSLMYGTRFQPLSNPPESQTRIIEGAVALHVPQPELQRRASCKELWLLVEAAISKLRPSEYYVCVL